MCRHADVPCTIKIRRTFRRRVVNILHSYLSASGEPINIIGMTTLQFQINDITFIHTFIICRNLRQPFILGLDFLRKYRIGTTWTEEGKFSLKYQNQIWYKL